MNLVNTFFLSCIHEPINLCILSLGLITTLLNLWCGFQAWKRRRALHKDMRTLSPQLEDPRRAGESLPMEATMYWATRGEYDDRLKKIVAGLKVIENIYQQDLEIGNWENVSRNLYSGLVEILPLGGIMGTLYAIYRQSLAQGSMDVVSIQSNFGLAIVSTLIALAFTAGNIFIENLYLHQIEYVDNCKSAFSAATLFPRSVPNNENSPETDGR